MEVGGEERRGKNVERETACVHTHTQAHMHTCTHGVGVEVSSHILAWWLDCLPACPPACLPARGSMVR